MFFMFVWWLIDVDTPLTQGTGRIVVPIKSKVEIQRFSGTADTEEIEKYEKEFHTKNSGRWVVWQAIHI